MKPNPLKMFEEFKRGNIDKASLINLMISIIEKYNEEEIYSICFEVLHKIASKDEVLFHFLENIIISDEREGVRCEALKYLKVHLLEISISILKWAVKHEKSYNCLIAIFHSLAKLNTEESRKILIEILKSIRKTKFIHTDKGFENSKFRRGLKSLFKSGEIKNFSQNQLSEILINHFSIKTIIETFPNVFFELNNLCLVKELDLSDYLEYEVKGTPWGWKNNIEHISKIPGIENLSKLEKLNLANNHIQDVKDIMKFKSLVYLDLSNNKLSNSLNISYLKQLPNLEFLDLRGNKIIDMIKSSEFNEKIRILKKNSFEELEQRLEERLK